MSGSADLFPQHCIAPPVSNEIHVNELSEQMQDALTKLTQRKQMLTILRTLALHLDAFISRTPLPRTPTSEEPPEEQRVVPLQQTEEQRVITFQEPPLQQESTAPPTILANNPTAPCILQTKPRTHQQKKRANTPSALPAIHRSHIIPPILATAPSVPTAKQIQVGKKRAQQTILSTDNKMPRRST